MAGRKSAYVARAQRQVAERERDEYDRFGPWVMKIESPGQLPPAFDPYGREVMACAMAVKVPFPVDRRDAVAGSDLYECVIAAGKAALVILDLDGGELRRREQPYAGLALISLSHEVLDGRLDFIAHGDDVPALRFNAVSLPLMQELVDVLRQRRAEAQGQAAAEPGPDLCAPPSEDSIFFKNLYSDQANREPLMSILAFQPEVRLSPARGRGSPLGIRALAALLPLSLPASLILELPGEVLVIREGSRPRAWSRRGYRCEHSWLAKGAIESAKVEERLARAGLAYYVLRIEVEGHAHVLAFAEAQAAAAERLAACARTAR